jgi:hypothetical protein
MPRRRTPAEEFQKLRSQAFTELETRAEELLARLKMKSGFVELLSRDFNHGLATVRFYDSEAETARVLKFDPIGTKESTALLEREFETLGYLHKKIPNTNQTLRTKAEEAAAEENNPFDLRHITFTVPEPITIGKGYFIRDNVPGTQVQTPFVTEELRELARNVYLLHEYTGVAGLSLNPPDLIRVARGHHLTAPTLEEGLASTPLVIVPVNYADAVRQADTPTRATYEESVHKDMKALFSLQNANRS